MDGTAYTACKTCGWNKGGKAYTTGAHSILQKKGCAVSYKLMCMMKQIFCDVDDGSEEVRARKVNIGIM